MNFKYQNLNFTLVNLILNSYFKLTNLEKKMEKNFLNDKIKIFFSY